LTTKESVFFFLYWTTWVYWL